MFKLIIQFQLLMLVLGCSCQTPTSKNTVIDPLFHQLWNHDFEPTSDGPWALPLLENNGIIVSGDGHIKNIDITSGKLLWASEELEKSPMGNGSFVKSGNVLLSFRGRAFYGVDINNGRLLWSHTISSSQGGANGKHPIVVGDDFLIASQATILHKINKNGIYDSISLGYRTYRMEFMNNELIIAGQRYGDDGLITAYNVVDYSVKWRFHPEKYGYPIFAPHHSDEATIYFGMVPGVTGSSVGYFALNKLTGNVIWEKTYVAYSSELVGEHLYIYTGRSIIKLLKNTGELIWQTEFGSSGAAPIAVGYGHVYAPHSGAMRILDAETGKIVDIVSPPDGSYYWRVTVGRGRVFAQTNRHLYAFAPWGRTEALE